MLMQIKAGGGDAASLWTLGKRGFAMPTDIAIAVTGIVIVFLIFTAGLAYADYTSRRLPKT
jgi:hypothetical protein